MMATPEHETDRLNDERLAGERWREWPTKAQVEAQIEKDRRAAETELWKQKVIAWRTRTNNWNVSEISARWLVEMAERYPNVYPGRKPEPRP